MTERPGTARAREVAAEAGGDPERVTVHRIDELPGVELWAFRNSDRHARFAPPAYAMCASTSGAHVRTSYRYRGRVVELHGRDLAVTEPGEVICTTHMGGRYDVYQLQIDPRWYVREFVESRASSAHFAVTAVPGAVVHEVFARAVAAFLDAPADPLEREHAVRALFGLVAAHRGEQQPARVAGFHRAVRRAREYLEAHYADRATLADVAAASGVSVFYLERCFATQMGLPVHAYLQLVRVRRAVELLSRGGAPAPVSDAVGFADQSHMTRAFRRHLGVTPGMVRRSGQDRSSPARRGCR